MKYEALRFVDEFTPMRTTKKGVIPADIIDTDDEKLKERWHPIDETIQHMLQNGYIRPVPQGAVEAVKKATTTRGRKKS